jgi:hypothetical protein
VLSLSLSLSLTHTHTHTHSSFFITIPGENLDILIGCQFTSDYPESLSGLHCPTCHFLIGPEMGYTRYPARIFLTHCASTRQFDKIQLLSPLTQYTSLNPVLPNAQACVYLTVHITKLQLQTTFPKPLYIPHSACIHWDPGC